VGGASRGILAEWIAVHPGSRPWAWWRWDAPEARRCLTGHAARWPEADAYGWYPREHWGAPAFVWPRPKGFSGYPQIEGEGTYLRRLRLLRRGERPAAVTLAPRTFDPFNDEGDG
jgi:hypothetical protein